jgi:anti-anti-sigma regulatory factor
VLVDLELTNELDVPGAEMLSDLSEELEAMGVELMLAGVHQPVQDLLARSGAVDAIGTDRIFAAVPAAVMAFDMREAASLHADDMGAIVPRIGELTAIAARHESETTDEQRALLAGFAATIDDFEPKQPS